MSTVVGWDIGGANLKLSVLTDGVVRATLQLPCPLWRGLDRLEQALDQARQRLDWPGRKTRHAVTLTGELVDLFPDRTTGVQQILDVVVARLPGPLAVYGGPSGLLSPAAAREHPTSVASANWHGSARLLAMTGGDGVLVDVGSTTSDIIPVRDATVCHQGLSDHERLVSGELVYAGVLRTPVMAMARSVRLDRQQVPLIAELFATAADVYRLTGDIALDADPWPTADGGARTVEGSARRLLRMIGLDFQQAGLDRARTLAQQLRRLQLRTLGRALDKVDGAGTARLVAAGNGRFLVHELAQRLGRPCDDFEQACAIHALDPDMDLANFAPAIAVAMLWEQTRD
ncbi:hypothetical protein M0534_03665 [Methylonatrum kenyense]|uniref:hydantoinase/oxoprolinase family protein n=1 Tax=Methylonatrum kenyense TaxID=455253 RepID=UPI0020BDDA75|nr:hydantoinase/oxoprolinase family protein [Methylonatrum kenyense]MCK8515433.1 hypothetical protein [Methylonatrum kenyense]